MIRLLVLAFCLLCPLNVLADIVVNDVDLPGADPSPGHTFRFTCADSAEPASPLLVDSSLRRFGQADAPGVDSISQERTGISFISAPALTESRVERISLLESFKAAQPSSSAVLMGTLVNIDDDRVRYDDGGVVWEEPTSSIDNSITGASVGTSAIPEPGSLILCVGLVGLGLVKRRRRKITCDPN